MSKIKKCPACSGTGVICTCNEKVEYSWVLATFGKYICPKNHMDTTTKCITCNGTGFITKKIKNEKDHAKLSN